MSASEDAEAARAGKLIERLLVDPEFRAEFRRDPAEACLSAGLPDLAAELGGSGKSMHTLELRESRSSLAGVVMAVAVEGMGIAEAQKLVQHGLPGNVQGLGRRLLHGHALPNPLQRARQLASPAGLQHQLGRATGGHVPHVPHGATGAATGGGGGAGAGAAGAGAAGAGGAGAGAAAAAAGVAGAGSGGAPVAGSGAAAGAGAAGATAGAGGGAGSGVGSATGQDVAGAGGSGGGASGGVGVSGGAGASGSAGAPGGAGSVPWPDQGGSGGGGGSAGSGGGGASAGSGGAGQSLAQTSGAGASGAQPPGAAVPAPPVPGAQPAQGGVVPQWPDPQGGAGGAATGGAGGGAGGLAQLLNSPQLSAPANVRAFLAAGGVDPRMVSVLDSALANHSIGLGQVQALTDPVHVQAVDIVSVDGQPVGPANFGARDLVTEIAALDPSVRPSEIGTPWPIRSQGFFSDAGSMNRLHLAFEMPGTGSPPAGGGGAAAGAGAGWGLYPAPGGGQPVVPGQGAVAGAVPGQAAVAGAVPGQPGAVQGVAAAVASPALPTPSNPGRGPEALLAYAHSMIGKLPESAGENLGPALDKFEADFGFHGAAWCGIFVGHALEAAGLNPPHSVASVASILQLAQNGAPPFQKGVLPLSAARPGDLVTFGGTEHVAIVTSIDSQGVHTVGGNTGPGLGNVAEVTFSPDSVTGVVRPDYAAAGPAAGGAGAATPAPPPAAPIPGAGSGTRLAAAPAGTPGVAGAPGVPAAGAAGAAPGTSLPGTPQFKALAKQEAAFQRHTVQFLQAVVPAPGSPLAGQVPGAAGSAGAIPGTSPAAGQVLGAQPIPSPDVQATVGQPSGIGAAQVADLATGAGAYPGDGAPKPAIARWMADAAQRLGLPRELPVMAALVESGLHNDAGGDRDSVGYFQMRTSIWDNGPYAGYTHNPNLQLKWFLDQAVALKHDRLTTDPSFGQDPSQYGNWIADIERPAAEYRGRYQLRLDETRQLLGGG
jgi:hypothetical protein